MKKFSSLLLVILLIISMASVSVTAKSLKKNKEFTKFKSYVGTNDDGEDIFYDGHVLRKNDKTDAFLKEETPVKCTADIDEEFAEDTVHVVLKHDISIDAEDLTQTLLAGIDNVEKVKDLTKYETGDIKTKFKEKKAKYKEKLKKKERIKNKEFYSTKEEDIPEVAENLAQSDIQEEHEGFHRILSVKLKNKGKQEVLDMIEELEKREFILAASPAHTKAYTSATTKTPNDPSYDNSNAEAIKLPEAWNITTGNESVLVGIMDAGINGNHPDLRDNINSELSKSFLEDEDEYDEFYRENPLKDDSGHGTKVAGVIGAKGNNNSQICGTCWNVSLVSLKVFYVTNVTNGEGYVYPDYLSVFDYANKKGIKILNFSLVNKNEFSGLKAAISNYNGLFVCSAGNYGDGDDNVGFDVDEKNDDNEYVNNTSVYPTRFTNSNLISVAACNTTNNTLANYSNYGLNSVDLAAPGTVRTTAKDGTIVEDSGTSFAAPYVTGAAALIMSKYPTISNYAIKSAILDNVTTKTNLSGKVKTGGLLNVYNALNAVAGRTYTIKYNSNGGTDTSIPNGTVTHGIPYTLPEPDFTRSGKQFAGWLAKRSYDNKWVYCDKNGKSRGWYTSGEQPEGYVKYLFRENSKIDLSSTLLIGSTLTMYAKWSTQYTISYEPNTGTGTMADSYGYYNVLSPLSKNTFTKEGYVFIGWSVYSAEYHDHIGTDGAWHSYTENYPVKYFKDCSFVYYEKNDYPQQDIYALAQWAPASTKKGDVNSDGVINSLDVTFIENYLEGTQRLTPTRWYAADYDRNGVVNADDSLLLQWYIDHRETIYEESNIYFD